MTQHSNHLLSFCLVFCLDECFYHLCLALILTDKADTTSRSPKHCISLSFWKSSLNECCMERYYISISQHLSLTYLVMLSGSHFSFAFKELCKSSDEKIIICKICFNQWSSPYDCSYVLLLFLNSMLLLPNACLEK